MNNFDNQDYQKNRKLILNKFLYPKNKVKELNEKIYKEWISVYFKNESCGDEITFLLKKEKEIIKEIKFHGESCALTTACADIFCDLLKEKNKNYFDEILFNFDEARRKKKYKKQIVQDLILFRDIDNFSNRINCINIVIDGLKKVL
jgi:nitrogen fixation protein NifU and related proteins